MKTHNNTQTNAISYKKYLQLSNRLNALESKGIELIHTKSKIRAYIGLGCLIVALVPNGLGFIFYPLGVSLITSSGYSIKPLLDTITHKINLFKYKLKNRNVSLSISKNEKRGFYKN